MKFFFVLAIIFLMGFGVAQKKGPLSEYKKKRHFEKTPEPKPIVKKKKAKKTIFVIQKHDASHLHYDFRLEINGVLKSWAVPKGLPTKPGDQRLAIETEDHPYDYATFEGNIPKGQYGGGSVMVWDNGQYENLRDIDMHDSYDEGKIEIFLEGKKINGSYALIHTPRGTAKNQWLLLKMKWEPEGKKASYKVTERSAKTGRTMKQIAEEE